MHSEDKVGCPKVESLAQKLKRCVDSWMRSFKFFICLNVFFFPCSVNSTVRIVAKNVRLTSENACDIISGLVHCFHFGLLILLLSCILHRSGQKTILEIRNTSLILVSIFCAVLNWEDTAKEYIAYGQCLSVPDCYSA